MGVVLTPLACCMCAATGRANLDDRSGKTKMINRSLAMCILAVTISPSLSTGTDTDLGQDVFAKDQIVTALFDEFIDSVDSVRVVR